MTAEMNTTRWRLRVTTAEPDVARVSMRRHQFTVGKPIDFDTESGHISALEYVLGALAAEIVNGLRVFAKRRRIEIDHVEAVVDGEVENALTYLEVIGESGRPGISGVSIKVYVASPHDEAVVRALWIEMLERLPLVATLEQACNLKIELTLTG
jgi:uncharacterized OsmC-like protein